MHDPTLTVLKYVAIDSFDARCFDKTNEALAFCTGGAPMVMTCTEDLSEPVQCSLEKDLQCNELALSSTGTALLTCCRARTKLFLLMKLTSSHPSPRLEVHLPAESDTPPTDARIQCIARNDQNYAAARGRYVYIICGEGHVIKTLGPARTAVQQLHWVNSSDHIEDEKKKKKFPYLVAVSPTSCTVWHADGAPIDCLCEEGGTISVVAAAPKYPLFAVACDSCKVHCWDVEQLIAASAPSQKSLPTPFLTLDSYDAPVRCMAWDGEGRYLATSDGSDCTVWDLFGDISSSRIDETDSIMCCGHDPSTHITSLAFQPDGPFLATVSNIGKLAIFDSRGFRPGGVAGPYATMQIYHSDETDEEEDETATVSWLSGSRIIITIPRQGLLCFALDAEETHKHHHHHAYQPQHQQEDDVSATTPTATSEAVLKSDEVHFLADTPQDQACVDYMASPLTPAGGSTETTETLELTGATTHSSEIFIIRKQGSSSSGGGGEINCNESDGGDDVPGDAAADDDSAVILPTPKPQAPLPVVPSPDSSTTTRAAASGGEVPAESDKQCLEASEEEEAVKEVVAAEPKLELKEKKGGAALPLLKSIPRVENNNNFSQRGHLNEGEQMLQFGTALPSPSARTRAGSMQQQQQLQYHHLRQQQQPNYQYDQHHQHQQPARKAHVVGSVPRNIATSSNNANRRNSTSADGGGGGGGGTSSGGNDPSSSYHHHAHGAIMHQDGGNNPSLMQHIQLIRDAPPTERPDLRDQLTGWGHGRSGGVVQQPLVQMQWMGGSSVNGGGNVPQMTMAVQSAGPYAQQMQHYHQQQQQQHQAMMMGGGGGGMQHQHQHHHQYHQQQQQQQQQYQMMQMGMPTATGGAMGAPHLHYQQQQMYQMYGGGGATAAAATGAAAVMTSPQSPPRHYHHPSHQLPAATMAVGGVGAYPVVAMRLSGGGAAGGGGGGIHQTSAQFQYQTSGGGGGGIHAPPSPTATAQQWAAVAPGYMSYQHGATYSMPYHNHNHHHHPTAITNAAVAAGAAMLSSASKSSSSGAPTPPKTSTTTTTEHQSSVNGVPRTSLQQRRSRGSHSSSSAKSSTTVSTTTATTSASGTSRSSGSSGVMSAAADAAIAAVDALHLKEEKKNPSLLAPTSLLQKESRTIETIEEVGEIMETTTTEKPSETNAPPPLVVPALATSPSTKPSSTPSTAKTTTSTAKTNTTTSGSMTRQQEDSDPSSSSSSSSASSLSTIYIGNLPPAVDEYTLAWTCAHYGPVAHVRIIRDTMTNTSRGYAFVTFMHSSTAGVAMQQLNGQVVLFGPYGGARVRAGRTNR